MWYFLELFSIFVWIESETLACFPKKTCQLSIENLNWNWNFDESLVKDLSLQIFKTLDNQKFLLKLLTQ